MKFKILKGTPLYIQLMELKARIDDANDQKDKFVESLGFERSASTGRNLAGGLEAIYIPFGKDVPEGWKCVQRGERYFIPRVTGKENKELWKKIDALPVLKNDELNDLLGYSAGGYSSNEGIGWAKRPGIAFGSKCIVVTTGEVKYKPVPGMIEIVDSEYNKLHEEIEREEEGKEKKRKPAKS